MNADQSLISANRSRRAALIAPLLAALPALAALALAPLLLPRSALAATSQGSGASATETRNVAEFLAVALSGSMDLVLRQGPQAVQVQADDNLLPLLETVVEQGSHGATLHVRWKKNNSLHTRSKVLVTVTSPKLSSLASSGAGDIKVDSYSTPALKISTSGSGHVRLDKLNTDELDISIAGSSDVVGNGKTTRLKVGIAGSGDVRLADLQADDVAIRIAGSGNAAVNAQKTLAVSISGSGDVRYTGNPALKSSVAGSGSISKK